MLSACTNPILYGFLNENFKKEFNAMFIKVRSLCRRREGGQAAGEREETNNVLLWRFFCRQCKLYIFVFLSQWNSKMRGILFVVLNICEIFSNNKMNFIFKEILPVKTRIEPANLHLFFGYRGLTEDRNELIKLKNFNINV